MCSYTSAIGLFHLIVLVFVYLLSAIGLFLLIWLVFVFLHKCIRAIFFNWASYVYLHIVGQESNPGNSEFYQNNFLSTREYLTHGAHSVRFS